MGGNEVVKEPNCGVVSTDKSGIGIGETRARAKKEGGKEGDRAGREEEEEGNKIRLAWFASTVVGVTCGTTKTHGNQFLRSAAGRHRPEWVQVARRPGFSLLPGRKFHAPRYLGTSYERPGESPGHPRPGYTGAQRRWDTRVAG